MHTLEWKPPNSCTHFTHCCEGVVCGAAASGNYVWNDPTDVAQLLVCTMMSGPFLTGYTQVRGNTQGVFM